jgi:thiol-disulfide isomerase/thioredoxin
MKKHTLAGIFSCIFALQLLAAKLPLRTGSYDSHLQLTKTVQLPVHLTVIAKGKGKEIVIKNDAEEIHLVLKSSAKDTMVFGFPDFDSELRVAISKKSKMDGYWVNFNKSGNYRIPFSAKLCAGERIYEAPKGDLNGKWETYFDPNSEDEEKTIAVLQQNGNQITGTVLTETGDYRFLQGVIEGNHFYLSAFDGTHAFLLNGTLKEKTIEGNFYSGKHYETAFFGKFNPDAELRDGDSITVMKGDEHAVLFELKDINGNNYSFPNPTVNGKVVIIQIMGTWCPNCMDETKFYKELYDAYHDKGLEIVSIGYEYADSFEEQVKKIQTLKERHNLNFTFLVGGKANKKLASEQFHMLNEVISFPTSIYIGRDGQVKRIHTGFNGPGTGSYYEEYVQKTHALIQQLLSQ